MNVAFFFLQQEKTKSAAEAKEKAARAAVKKDVSAKAAAVTQAVLQAKAQGKAEPEPVKTVKKVLPRVSLRKRNKHLKIFEDLVKVMACVCMC
jgi:hypothetical protein